VEEKMKNNNETFIFAHSFGGIIALSLLEKNKEKIKKIITMASPHGRELF
jgi:pimeloyl-ACP methyl ester carboxylesterase